MARTSWRTNQRTVLATMAILTQAILFGCEEQDPQQSKPAAPLKHNEAEDVRKYMNLSRPQSTVGELVYVPVYSSIFNKKQRGEYYLSSTLSIHNIHLSGTMWLSAVNYYNTRGQRVREFVNEPLPIRPLETQQFVIPDTEQSGGTGANYIVKWEAEHDLPSPKIEALMISTHGQQGISFMSHGTVVTRLTRTATAAGEASPRPEGRAP